MATKPTNLFRWASAGGAVITEPTSGKKDTGFGTTAEVLAGELLNWLHNGAYQWFLYLDAFLTDAHTWAGAQTFSGAVNLNGTNTLSTATTLAHPTITYPTINANYVTSSLLLKPSYWKDAYGVVHLAGGCTTGVGAVDGDILFTLAAGSRPQAQARFHTFGGNLLTIESNGNVVVTDLVTTGVSLDGLHFDVNVIPG